MEIIFYYFIIASLKEPENLGYSGLKT